MNDETVFVCEDVCKSYPVGRKRLQVLRGVNWRIPSGAWSALLGASGSGKTTLLNILGTLEKPDGGRVLFRDTDLGRLGSRAASAFRAKELGYVFQAYQLLPELTLLENVMLPNLLAGMDRRKCRSRALELLERVGLSERLRHHPSELSGGEQQRAAIARALVKFPRVLLADEPTGNLDSASGEAILRLFGELRDSGLTIVMITHNAEAAERADRVVKLADGVIV